MSKLTELREALDDAEKAYGSLKDASDTEARKAADVARKAVLAKYEDERLALSEAFAKARAAWQAELDSTATHEWEGRKVIQQKNVGRGYAPRYEAVYGVVEVRKSTTEFPGNTANYSKPQMGRAFVRLLNKDGTPGKRFERMSTFNPWKLAE